MGSSAFYHRQHVGINAHLLSNRVGYRRAGIHHYISQLLGNLSYEESELRITLFTNNRDDLGSLPKEWLVTTSWPTQRPLARIMWEQLAWPIAAIRHKVDLLHSMAFVTPLVQPCPSVVTVYDLSFIYHPQRFPALKRVYLTSQTRRSCQQAERVMTISESGRQDVHRFYNIPLDRIDIVRPGVSQRFSPRNIDEVEAFRHREQLSPRFILHVGTLQPRKNIEVLVDAFAQLSQPDLELVLVGGKGWSYHSIFAHVRDLGLADKVRFAGYVSDADLPLWYNAAAALVYPSVYEGFGLPVIQAMACGTPVIAAKTSAIPEAAGSAALFFDPHDITALAEHIAAVLDDPQIAVTMRQQGLAQACEFSWQKAGQQLLASYQSVFSK
jgi:glycosyltransferase involved in cell wall biosynthesis